MTVILPYAPYHALSYLCSGTVGSRLHTVIRVEWTAKTCQCSLGMSRYTRSTHSVIRFMIRFDEFLQVN